VKRRRDWANALYFFVNPVDAYRRSANVASREDVKTSGHFSQKNL
jgi:hypothetical protein